MVLAIGWLDVVTGPDIGLSLLYLIPIAISGWFGGVSHAVIVASLATAVWLGADVSWRKSDVNAIALWNAFTRLVIYTSEGVFIALLRRDREMMRSMLAREKALARTDHATRLPNMRAFLEATEAELERAHATGDPMCVIYIDLDNFKAFNDRLGHAAGDDLLDAVGTALKSSIRDEDLVARLGGDEFAVLAQCADPDTASSIAENIATTVRQLGSAFPDLRFGATVGVAYFREAPESADDLIRAADDAMYSGKSTRKGGVVFQNL